MYFGKYFGKFVQCHKLDKHIVFRYGVYQEISLSVGNHVPKPKHTMKLVIN